MTFWTKIQDKYGVSNTIEDDCSPSTSGCDEYSLRKDRVGNVFAKFVGTQSGVNKRTIWVAKPIVTNLLGPNLAGDQQAQT